LIKVVFIYCNKTMNKAEFAVSILKEYANENKINARDTSDLSQLEQWLLIKLYEIQNKKDQIVNVLQNYVVEGYRRERIIYEISIDDIADEIVELLGTTDVSNCTLCNAEINYKGLCEMCYTEQKLNDLD